MKSKRSLRRHQQRVAKLRRIRILRAHGTFDPYSGFFGLTPRWTWPEKPWRPFSTLVLLEPGPGWWRHEMAIVPARIDSHRLEHAIEVGRDPDSMNWPNYRRPNPYYW